MKISKTEEGILIKLVAAPEIEERVVTDFFEEYILLKQNQLFYREHLEVSYKGSDGISKNRLIDERTTVSRKYISALRSYVEPDDNTYRIAVYISGVQDMFFAFSVKEEWEQVSKVLEDWVFNDVS